jgi:hypothetical protein
MKTSTHSTRKPFALLAVAAAATALSLACATTPVPKPAARASANQQIVYEDGAEKIISMRPGSMVSLRLADPTGGRSTFVVGVANQTTYPVVIGPEMVTVVQSGRPLRVFSYEEVAEQERRARENEMITRAILGGVSSGLSSFAGVSAPSMNLSALQSGLSAAQQGVATSASQREVTLKEISTTALKKNTLFPTQQGGGVVYTEKIRPGPIHVRVQISEDVHDFEFGF